MRPFSVHVQQSRSTLLQRSPHSSSFSRSCTSTWRSFNVTLTSALVVSDVTGNCSVISSGVWLQVNWTSSSWSAQREVRVQYLQSKLLVSGFVLEFPTFFGFVVARLFLCFLRFQRFQRIKHEFKRLLTCNPHSTVVALDGRVVRCDVTAQRSSRVEFPRIRRLVCKTKQTLSADRQSNRQSCIPDVNVNHSRTATNDLESGLESMWSKRHAILGTPALPHATACSIRKGWTKLSSLSAFNSNVCRH